MKVFTTILAAIAAVILLAIGVTNIVTGLNMVAWVCLALFVVVILYVVALWHE